MRSEEIYPRMASELMFGADKRIYNIANKDRIGAFYSLSNTSLIRLRMACMEAIGARFRGWTDE